MERDSFEAENEDSDGTVMNELADMYGQYRQSIEPEQLRLDDWSPEDRTISMDQVQVEYAQHSAEFLTVIRGIHDTISLRERECDVILQQQRPAEIARDDIYEKYNDVQGIQWSWKEWAREARRIRNKWYPGYYNLPGSRDKTRKMADAPFTNETLYRFERLYTFAKPRPTHFQLRHLLVPISRQNIYYSDTYVIKCLDADSGRVRDVAVQDRNLVYAGLGTKITAIDGNRDVVIAGGFYGRYFYKNLATGLDQTTPSGIGLVSPTATHNNNTNHVSVIGTKALFSCNDSTVRTLDLNTNKMVQCVELPFAVNCSATSPDSTLRVVVGDAKEARVISASRGEKVMSLYGHQDYSFACAWSPDGHTVVTGNQDMTCRVYDVRRSDRAVHVIGAQLDSVRSVKFDSTGRQLLMAETVDYVSVVETGMYTRGQVLEFWGGVSGAGFCAESEYEDESLWVGVYDQLVGGMMHFERRNAEWVEYGGEELFY
ncbi:WD40-repeat-containing domain protein [Lipomyces arxii]|uniref:WD40-repeat-containing domain protein n=1 Tax=Lipomyces arxii TaxID=56418 RepID=UPI0034CF8D71